MDTDMDMEYGFTWSVHGMKVYMEYSYTSHSIISISIQTWIWIQSMGWHGVWRHSTLCNTHIDTDMDIDTQYRHTLQYQYGYKYRYAYGMKVYMEYSTPHSIISILSFRQLLNWCIEIYFSYLDLINDFIFGTFEIIYFIYTTNT